VSGTRRPASGSASSPASAPWPGRAPAPWPGAASLADIEHIVRGEHGAPFDVLGPHAAPGEAGVNLRVWAPGAREVSAVLGRRRVPLVRRHRDGFFEAQIAAPGGLAGFRYRLAVTGNDGETALRDDPYRFPPLLGEFDLHLFGEGTHDRIHEVLGAHVMERDGVDGVNFAVWAPNALRVSLIGPFNRWNERAHPMRLLQGTGVWELFVPGLAAGELYKFHIRTRLAGRGTIKADPYGFAMERRPQTASVVCDLGKFRWRDEAWMAGRAAQQSLDKPILIYEVHAGSWKRVADEENRWLDWRELAQQLVPYAKRMGYTHLELMPVSEHPYDASWGYQPTGLFAPTSRFGTPEDFRAFVDAAHRAGLGVIIDWVPAHFPKDAHGLGFFDGTHLYEHADPRKGEHKDWGTYIYNFGRPQVVSFLIASALFWLEHYHIDGLRVDAVASMLYLDYSRKEGEWEPNRHGGRENLEAVDFLRRVNRLVHERFPGVLTIAEESTAWPGVTAPVEHGGLGFDLKWNMGWMHDMLEYMRADPLGRSHMQGKLTFSLYYAYSERFLLPLSHDEVVHGKHSLLFKMPGDRWNKFANLRALYAYMAAHPGKKLLFMGGELGQRREWAHDNQLDWNLIAGDDEHHESHRSLHRFVRDLNRLVQATPALFADDFRHEGFQWIDFQDAASSVVSFVRRGRQAGELLLVVANFTPVPRENYRIGVPVAGKWSQRLNSDAAIYGGSGLGQPAGVTAEPEAWHGHAQSVVLTLPPLAVLFLEPGAAKARKG